ncbi:MAG: hypothetical protein GOV15_01750, partial [Candidatus Diapherotrites archaeon]|nr:hypothetical protein [Candidatus Diapherotrites archaeon]
MAEKFRSVTHARELREDLLVEKIKRTKNALRLAQSRQGMNKIHKAGSRINVLTEIELELRNFKDKLDNYEDYFQGNAR